MMFEQRRARKRKQQRRGECLTAIMTWRKSRIRLTGYRWRLLSQLVLQRGKRRAICGSGSGNNAILNILQLLHGTDLVPHVQTELAEFLLLYQCAMFALTFPSRCPYTLAARKLCGGELRGRWDKGLLRGRRDGRLSGGCCERLLRVRDGGNDRRRGLLLLLLLWWLLLLLLLLLLLGGCHTHQSVL